MVRADLVFRGVQHLKKSFEARVFVNQYDADEKVFASLQETWPGIDWKALANYTTGRMVVHGERRAREMEEVAGTLKAIGVEPMMAEATARRQHWSAQLDLKSHFGPDGPSSYADVVDLVSRLNPDFTAK